MYHLGQAWRFTGLGRPLLLEHEGRLRRVFLMQGALCRGVGLAQLLKLGIESVIGDVGAADQQHAREIQHVGARQPVLGERVQGHQTGGVIATQEGGMHLATVDQRLGRIAGVLITFQRFQRARAHQLHAGTDLDLDPLLERQMRARITVADHHPHCTRGVIQEANQHFLRLEQLGIADQLIACDQADIIQVRAIQYPQRHAALGQCLEIPGRKIGGVQRAITQPLHHLIRTGVLRQGQRLAQ